MKKMLKMTSISLITVLGLLLLLTILGFLFIRNPWTPVNGEIEIPAIGRPVEITRDSNGVVNIYGESPRDTILAQGFVHAQDRLWQMEMMRQLCRGNLSSFLGKSTIKSDKYFRIIGLNRIAENSYRMLDEESRSYLRSYSEGVNAYIARFRGRLPIEYSITGLKPEPWMPEDSLIITAMLALNMGLNARFEYIRPELIKLCGEEAVKELMCDNPEKLSPVIKSKTAGPIDDDHLAMIDELLNNFNVSWGSNNWVVHGDRTNTGEPFLANDTHLGLSMPSVWYENNLHTASFEVGGFSIPGIPLVIIGHNTHIFWGLSNLDPDVQDLYIEKVDDEKNPTKYLFKGKYRKIERLTETIEVKNSSPTEMEILFTHHGPIINDAFGLTEWSPTALKWAMYDSSQAFKALLHLNRAENWEQFREALRDWDGLHQNFVYADRLGNIGYQAAGKIPIRVKNHSGILPASGWSGDYEWSGYIPFDELPCLLNPPEGYIVTANNRIADDYPHQLCIVHFPGFRAERINSLLGCKRSYDIEDMKAIMGDTYSLEAEKILPYLLNTTPKSERQEQALELLKKWDLRLDTDSTAAAIYETWYIRLLINTVSDELDTSARDYINYFRKHVLTMNNFLKDNENNWFDDAATKRVETGREIIERSFEEALDRLTEQMGKNIERWRWGKIHTVNLKQQPIGNIFKFLNTNVEVAGGNSTVNQGMYQKWGPPFRVNHGTSQRIIMDLSDPDETIIINSSGQNGNYFHPHRLDQTELFRKIQYISLPISRERVEKSSVARLVLRSKSW